MPSPFPGMDPYLETPDLWPDVHHGLIGQMRAMLNPLLRPHYVARIEVRLYDLDADDPGYDAIIPNILINRLTNSSFTPRRHNYEIQEAFISIKDRKSGAPVTVIEVMNPANKIRGSAGRKSFVNNRRKALDANLHWVEIDLLRNGESIMNPPVPSSDYHVLVSRAGDYKARLWPINILQKLPVIGIPLRGKESDVALDLGAVLNTVYDVSEYDASIDYSKPPDPPLRPDDDKWANNLLRAKGLR